MRSAEQGEASGSALSPCAVVTGASSGIGEAFAQRLSRDGYRLLITGRNRQRLEELAISLREESQQPVEVMVADLTQPDELRRVETWIASEPDLALLVNSAGYGGYRAFATSDPEDVEELICLQVIAVTRLTRAALPGMIARGQGAVINISSLLAFSAKLPSPPMPKRAVYAATKAYINTFTQLVANELTGTGVQAQALVPGMVLTDFHARAGIDPQRLPAGMMMTPHDVVEASLQGLRLGEVICVPALDDPSPIGQIQEGERLLTLRGNRRTIANRYQP
jgi:short-subunit dehydrogenase